MSRKIAPTLVGLLDLYSDGYDIGFGKTAGMAKRELRALLAVARSARRECDCKPGDNCPVQRALARLDRACQGTGRRP